MNAFEVVQAHAVGEFGDLVDEGLKLLDRAVAEVQIDSAWGPSYAIENPFSPSPEPGVGSKLGPFLKPKLTLKMRSGWGGNRVIAPYGDPGASKFPYVVLGVWLVGLVVAARKMKVI